MGLPPAHVQPISVVVNPELRRWLSQFFAGLLDKTEKSGTVPAAWVCANPKTISSIHASFSTNNHLQFAAGTVPFFLSALIQLLVFYSGYDPIIYQRGHCPQPQDSSLRANHPDASGWFIRRNTFVGRVERA